MVSEGEMLEHAHVFGNFYGSPRGPVESAINAGSDVLFDIDWQGAQQIANSPLAQHVLSFYRLRSMNCVDGLKAADRTVPR